MPGHDEHAQESTSLSRPCYRLTLPPTCIILLELCILKAGLQEYLHIGLELLIKEVEPCLSPTLPHTSFCSFLPNGNPGSKVSQRGTKCLSHGIYSDNCNLLWGSRNIDFTWWSSFAGDNQNERNWECDWNALFFLLSYLFSAPLFFFFLRWGFLSVNQPSFRPTAGSWKLFSPL